MHATTALAATLGLAMTTGALAQNAAPTAEPAKTLAIGDKAPKIDIEHWVLKGKDVKPFKTFEDGKVYVVEFWATWCGPCRMSMPHMTELQHKYADYDVTIVGVSDEPLETVTTFLDKVDTRVNKKWSEVIGYTLCTDPDVSVKNDYFKAAGLRGIPSAFIVGKDGHVEWIGHPMQMDEPLDRIVRDDWDRKDYQAKREQEEAGQKNAMRFQQLLMEGGQDPETYKLGQDVVKGFWDNAGVLNQIAWMVVDNAAVKNRNYDFAMKVANRAVELTEWKDGAIIDTLARVYHDTGDLKKAIEIQRKAAKVAEGDNSPMSEGIRATLEQYEKEAKGG
jgi:thiol-disulfide isomerase/thioredoxin